MKLPSLQHWLDWIMQQHVAFSPGSRVGIRIQAVAEALNLTHFDCPVLMIAGTNGKGSTSALVRSFYPNLSVGVYSSPHIHQFNERATISDQPFSDAEWMLAFECVSENAPFKSSFFEFITLAALVLFQQSKLDLLILEVGLGGRFDPVNVVNADVAVITSIALDHQAQLGHTREAIAYEKAGIFKPHCHAVIGDARPPEIVTEIARGVGVGSLYQIGIDFDCVLVDAQQSTCRYHNRLNKSGLKHLVMPTPHLKLSNLATAICAAELLPLDLKQEAIVNGSADTRLPGRFECWTQPHPLIFDVAHNEAAVGYLAQRLRAKGMRSILAVVALKSDKCLPALFSALTSNVSQWYVASLNVPGGAAVREILPLLSSEKCSNYQTFASVSLALKEAITDFKRSHVDAILVFGSFHAVQQAQCSLKQNSE